MLKKPLSPVPVPAVKGLKIYKNGYVYYASSQKWDKEKKRPVDNRRCIGKLDPDNEGCIIPNDTFYSIFPELSDLQEQPVQSDVLDYGTWTALEAAAEKCGILDALKSAYPDTYRSILAFAFYMISDQNSTAQGFDVWHFSHYCDLSSPLSSQNLSRLFARLGEDEGSVREFLASYRENYMKNIPHTGKMVLAFDSSNQNTSSKRITMAEFGKAKVDEGLPDINEAMFVDETTGINLFYESFYGSLLDKSETPFTIEKAADLGFQDLFLIMDRGYCSQGVVSAIEKQCSEERTATSKMEFAVSCPSNLVFVKDMIKCQSSEIIDNEDCYIYAEEAYGKCYPYQAVFGGEYCLYLFYDPKRAAQEKGDIHAKVMGLMKTALKHVKYSKKLADKYKEWLIITPLEEKNPSTGRNYTVQANKEKIQKEINKTGLFVVLSNAEMPAGEMLELMRKRDKSEKAFSQLKDQLDMKKSGCHNQETFDGKTLVAFVALAIRLTYAWMIRDILASKSSMTVATALGELSKYRIYQKEDGGWYPRYAMTKMQKDIFKKMDLDEHQIVKMVTAIKG